MLINNFKPIDIRSISKKNSNPNVEQEPKKDSFFTIMKDTVENANQLQKSADQKSSDYIAGKTDNLHEVMISMQKAELAMSFVIEVRNRVEEGYKEFSRMQV